MSTLKNYVMDNSYNFTILNSPNFTQNNRLSKIYSTNKLVKYLKIIKSDYKIQVNYNCR